jgi:hypothetical protein
MSDWTTRLLALQAEAWKLKLFPSMITEGLRLKRLKSWDWRMRVLLKKVLVIKHSRGLQLA